MTPYLISLPVIYLDFDGVLHPDAAYRTKKGIVLKNYAGHSLFENAALLSEVLRPYPQVRIVLSTSWVKELGYQKALERLPLELADRVIGATWHTRMDARQWSYMTRYEQIQRHASRHSVSNWLALDDDTHDWHFEALHRVVQCDTRYGFTLEPQLHQLKSWLTQTREG